MIKWIRNNWKDPVWSKVFAWMIIGVLSLCLSGLWILAQKIFNSISFEESFNEFIRIINIQIYIPLWLIMILTLSLLVFVIINKLKGIKSNITDNGKNENLSTESKNIPKTNTTRSIIHEDNKILMAKHNLNAGFTSQFLKEKHGTFSIWAYVSDVHNKLHDYPRKMYIISFATNKGELLGNPTLAKYPNVWAILRIAPTPKNPNGIWRFWCNDISKEVTRLDYEESLLGGWHLFSVSWSKDNNYIKFIIDTSLVAENSFSNWPSDLSAGLAIGTWPNKMRDHYFDSKIGPRRFIPEEYSEKLIKQSFLKKPE